MPGLRAPAFFVSTVLAGAALLAPLPATAQQEIPRPQARPPASSVPVPGQLELSKMLWSTIVAVDQANRSGNYSVLRDMAAQSFQIANNAATLAQAFAPFRQLQIDLSNVLLIAPTYTDAPRMVQDNVLEIKGVFQLRPTSIYFDVF